MAEQKPGCFRVGCAGVLSLWLVAMFGSQIDGCLSPEIDVDIAAEAAEMQDPALLAAADSARAVVFAELDSLFRAGDYVQTQDVARSLAAEPFFAAAADSLYGVADRAEEEAMYERARRISGSKLEENRDAYQELADRFPASARASLYATKASTYGQRVIERDSRRYRAYAPRSSASRGCCRRCSSGQPCGDSCISWSYTCRKGPGCAC